MLGTVPNGWGLAESVLPARDNGPDLAVGFAYSGVALFGLHLALIGSPASPTRTLAEVGLSTVSSRTAEVKTVVPRAAAASSAAWSIKLEKKRSRPSRL